MRKNLIKLPIVLSAVAALVASSFVMTTTPAEAREMASYGNMKESRTFSYLGKTETITFPNNVPAVLVNLTGGSGGCPMVNCTTAKGESMFVKIDLKPGDVLTIHPAQNASTGSQKGGKGFVDGGKGGDKSLDGAPGGGGGGAAAVLINGKPAVVAGGGGGMGGKSKAASNAGSTTTAPGASAGMAKGVQSNFRNAGHGGDSGDNNWTGQWHKPGENGHNASTGSFGGGGGAGGGGYPNSGNGGGAGKKFNGEGPGGGGGAGASYIDPTRVTLIAQGERKVAIEGGKEMRGGEINLTLPIVPTLEIKETEARRYGNVSLDVAVRDAISGQKINFYGKVIMKEPGEQDKDIEVYGSSTVDLRVKKGVHDVTFELSSNRYNPDQHYYVTKETARFNMTLDVKESYKNTSSTIYLNEESEDVDSIIEENFDYLIFKTNQMIKEFLEEDDALEPEVTEEETTAIPGDNNSEDIFIEFVTSERDRELETEINSDDSTEYSDESENKTLLEKVFGESVKNE